MVSLLLLGFSSGLPLPLVGGTLQALLTQKGVGLGVIGLFTLTGIPYTVKFLWSPLFDRFLPPFLGRRKGWILFTQCLLFVFLPLVPRCLYNLSLLYVLTVGIAFLSASQDIVVDALRTDILEERERGAGVAVFILGYRIALLTSSALALFISDGIGWEITYLFLGSLLLLGVLGCLLSGEKEPVAPPRDLADALIGPLRDLLSRERFLFILLFLVLYKLGDAYLGSMTVPFLIRGMGFSLREVAVMMKGVGFLALISGAFLAGALMVRVSLFRALLFFGILQMVSNLFFLWLWASGKDLFALFLVMLVENFSGGLGTTAFVSYMMSLCNARYSATQFALLSSLSALGRVVVAPTSGFFVERFGWPSFFLLSTGLSAPGILVLLRIGKGEKGPSV